MNATRRTLTLTSLALAVGLLAGCNWIQLLAFRSQMRAFQEFTAWEGTGAAVFVFKKPLFTLEDLNGLGLYPERIDAHHAVLRYRRIGAPPEMPTVYDIEMKFIEGRLAGLEFPAPLRDGLGRDTIRWIFAAMGGSEVAAGGGLGVPKTQLISAGLFPPTAEGLGREAVIDLRPLDPRNGSLSIKLAEKQRSDCYNKFSFILKPSPLAEPSGGGAQN
jgi:hypothetical protein